MRRVTRSDHRDRGSVSAFLSYSRSDIEFVERLRAALSVRSIDCRIDREQIDRGEDWWNRIEQLITEVDAVVFILSRASAASRVCRDEISVAQRAHKRILPVVIDDVPPDQVLDTVSRINYIYFTPNPRVGSSGHFDTAMEELVQAIKTDGVWIREHTRLGVIAARWDQQGRPASLLLRGTELTAAEHWFNERSTDSPDPTENHRSLVLASRRAATRRLRYLVAGSLVVTLISSGLALFAYRQSVEADRQKTAALSTLSRGLLEKSAELNRQRRIPESAALAAQALRTDPTNLRAYVALFESLAQLRWRLRYEYTWPDPRSFLTLSFDGDLIATLDNGNSGDEHARISIIRESTQKVNQIEVPEYPAGAMFSSDARYLFLLNEHITVIDCRQNAVRKDLSTTARVFGSGPIRPLPDIDPSFFWTADYSGLHRYNMSSFTYDKMLPLEQLTAPGFIGHNATHLAQHEHGRYWAVAISGQSEGYTGEADDTGRVFLFDRMANGFTAYLNTGLVNDIMFSAAAAGSQGPTVLYVAKPGGTLEAWTIPTADLAPRNPPQGVELRTRTTIWSKAEIDFHVLNPDPQRSSKMTLLSIGPDLGVFTSGQLTLIEQNNHNAIQGGVFDDRTIDYFSDEFVAIGLNRAFATVNQNDVVSDHRIKTNRLRVWDLGSGLAERANLEDAFRRTYDERAPLLNLVAYLGVTGDWKIRDLGGSKARIAFLSHEAHTRYSTRYVLNVLDVDREETRALVAHPMPDSVDCGKPRLYETGSEVCAFCNQLVGAPNSSPPWSACIDWKNPLQLRSLSPSDYARLAKLVNHPTETGGALLSILKSVGSDRIEFGQDGDTVLFRQGQTPFLWRGANFLRRPAEEIASTTERITGLRVDGFQVGVTAGEKPGGP